MTQSISTAREGFWIRGAISSFHSPDTFIVYVYKVAYHPVVKKDVQAYFSILGVGTARFAYCAPIISTSSYGIVSDSSVKGLFGPLEVADSLHLVF